MRLPDFLIIGTQKAGTTWLEAHLAAHPDVVTPRRQVHFFDRAYARGLGWYRAQFPALRDDQLLGEKTTEYFDTATLPQVAPRLAQDLPQAKLIVILRDPVRRAFSALDHMVTSGLVPIPADPDRALWDDIGGYRYIERGYYAQQLAVLETYVASDQVLVLIFEEDIVADPVAGWQKVCGFLGISDWVPQDLGARVNTLRLSRLGVTLSRWLYAVPYARGVIRRIDPRLPLQRWRAAFKPETAAKLHAHYAPEREALFARLGRRVPSWEQAS